MDESTWAKVLRKAGDLREHWNRTRARAAQPGDSRVGDLIGELLQAIEKHKAREQETE